MSSPFRSLVFAGLLLSTALPSPARANAVCSGDCNADGTIDASDIADVMAAIFDPHPQSACPGLATEGPAAGAADLLSAVGLTGECSAPSIPPLDVYRTYAGFEIALPIGAEDPDGVEYAAEGLPDGALLEPDTGIFRWTPTEEQIGAYHLPFQVRNSRHPNVLARGALALRVTPLDSCAIPSCDPATGCTSTLPPLTQPCCAPGPVARVPEILFDCPGGKVLMVGQNNKSGFGRMQNCDKLHLIRPIQTGVTINLHFAANCVTINELLNVHVVVELADQIHSDKTDSIIMLPTDVGFSQRLNYSLKFLNATMALEGQEANLSVSLEDFINPIVVSETIRVVVTHEKVDDLPDLPPAPPGAPAH